MVLRVQASCLDLLLCCFSDSTLPSAPQAFPVLVGDMDNSGSLNAQVIHQLSPGLRSKMAIQVSCAWLCVACHAHRCSLMHGPHTAPPPQTQQSKFVNWQVDGEYRGSDFTAAVTLGNPDVLVGSGKRWGRGSRVVLKP